MIFWACRYFWSQTCNSINLVFLDSTNKFHSFTIGSLSTNHVCPTFFCNNINLQKLDTICSSTKETKICNTRYNGKEIKKSKDLLVMAKQEGH